jgi:hypothetical protein
VCAGCVFIEHHPLKGLLTGLTMDIPGAAPLRSGDASLAPNHRVCGGADTSGLMANFNWRKIEDAGTIRR